MTAPAILAINAGSSSLKFALFAVASDGLSAELRGKIARGERHTAFEATDRNGAPLAVPVLPEVFSHAAAIGAIVELLSARDLLPAIAAVGHRVVHGGGRFVAPIRLDAQVRAALAGFHHLAPLHMPPALAGMTAVDTQLPGILQFACFDTAFHATMQELSRRLPLPERFATAGLRRYGFHGLSYEHVAASLPRLAGGRTPARVIAFHLGAGASLCAMRDGCCVTTSMGFSTLEGLMMGTRSGSIDPGVILHLLEHEGLSPADISRLLYHEAGLRGVSGESGDMRALLASATPAARLAIDMFCWRAASEAAASLPALQGLDAIVFTGGVGENAAPIRARIAAHLAFTGLQLDEGSNAVHAAAIDASTSAVRAWIVPADEELTIARAALPLMEAGATHQGE